MTDNLDLFNPPRIEGMRRAVEHANRVEPEWSDTALRFLNWYAQGAGKSFLVEEVVMKANQYSMAKPPTTKAWGAVVRKAAKQGWLVKDGFAIGQGNCCAKILWRHV